MSHKGRKNNFKSLNPVRFHSRNLIFFPPPHVGCVSRQLEGGWTPATFFNFTGISSLSYLPFKLNKGLTLEEKKKEFSFPSTWHSGSKHLIAVVLKDGDLVVSATDEWPGSIDMLIDRLALQSNANETVCTRPLLLVNANTHPAQTESCLFSFPFP